MAAQPTGKTFAEESGSQTVHILKAFRKNDHILLAGGAHAFAMNTKSPLSGTQNEEFYLRQPRVDPEILYDNHTGDGKRKETDPHLTTHLWNKRRRSDSSVQNWIRHNYRWPMECNLISKPQRAKYKDRSFDRSSNVHWGHPFGTVVTRTKLKEVSCRKIEVSLQGAASMTTQP
ncbi:hypothetical protein GX48_07909 [Paracoccidioides brasiliensis]|nr:hypothetical protein GX48_07909 [Paracoccidioides brasiliensis]